MNEASIKAKIVQIKEELHKLGTPDTSSGWFCWMNDDTEIKEWLTRRNLLLPPREGHLLHFHEKDYMGVARYFNVAGDSGYLLIAFDLRVPRKFPFETGSKITVLAMLLCWLSLGVEEAHGLEFHSCDNPQN